MSKWKMSFFVLALVAAMVVFGGCGGGSDSTAGHTPSVGAGDLQGYFIDGPVRGLTYTTSSGITGTTDAEGKFSYKETDTIVFKVGNISLPSVTAAGVILPRSYYSGSDNSDTRVQRLVQFIASTNATKPVAGGNIVVQDNYYPPTYDGREYSETLFDEIFAADPALIKLTPDEATAHANASEVAVKARYEGSYKGTWRHNNGTFNGEWSLTIAANGDISGQYTGEDWGSVSGYLDPTGSTELSTSGQAGGVAMWSGSVNLASGVMSGTYEVYDGSRGTFTGKKQ